MNSSLTRIALLFGDEEESKETTTSKNAAVDRRSGSDNMTALMRATYKGDQECVQRLLDAGADPTFKTRPRRS
jgi:ankyrin repeat protein